MADNNEEETWSVQHRLLLSNALEVMPSQNWPAISRLVRHFSLSATFNGDPVSYVAKVRCGLQKWSSLPHLSRIFSNLADLLSPRTALHNKTCSSRTTMRL